MAEEKTKLFKKRVYNQPGLDLGLSLAIAKLTLQKDSRPERKPEELLKKIAFSELCLLDDLDQTYPHELQEMFLFVANFQCGLCVV